MRQKIDLKAAVASVADTVAAEISFSELVKAYSAVQFDGADLRLRKWVEAFGHHSAWELTTEMLANAADAMLGHGYKPSSVNRDTSSIGTIYRWAARRRLCPKGFRSPTIGLERFAEGVRVVSVTSEEIGDYSMLGDIRRCLYQYRLNYRFSTVSEEARHNHVHTLWRKSLGIDKLAEEVDADVGQVSAFAEAKRFATLKTLFQVGGSVGAAITGVFGLDAVLNLELRQRMLKRASSFVNDIGATDWISSHFGVSEIFIVLIIICSGWFAFTGAAPTRPYVSPVLVRVRSLFVRGSLHTVRA